MSLAHGVTLMAGVALIAFGLAWDTLGFCPPPIELALQLHRTRLLLTFHTANRLMKQPSHLGTHMVATDTVSNFIRSSIQIEYDLANENYYT